ncbi:FAD dependent oxidoreductase [Trametes versicolor FP-101664 SS1]|uniref:FAD dependent oxidoreductase n=1 Tax=Trametes versicolor (strain FP-101664) TaxID=717944 RepID=UPI000462139E|nr:FAD dependent oxidoreductase [Trametes versicolor FP-101664 SS1]EIW59961.1 FAD dependent oxidoreductase [Trametes versicolor FP-101664 SS1]
MAVLPVFLNAFAEHQEVFMLPPDGARTPLPVPNSTHSFWINTPGANPLAKEGSEGPLTADADIAIIGSGITGVSAAYHISRLLAETGDTGKPLTVVVLEARDFCSGATGRNGGHLTANIFQDFAVYSSLHGTDDAKRAIALETRTVSEIVKIANESGKTDALDLVSGGRNHLLFTDEEVAEADLDYATAKAAGVDLTDVEFLTKEQVKERYGASYPSVRTPGYNIWPLKLVSHLYTTALSTAANSSAFSLALHTNTPVTALTPISGTSSSPRRWNLTTPRGPVAATYVLHATNAYASHLLAHMHGPDGIVPSRGQIIATRAAVPSSVLTTSAYTGNVGFEYWFPRPVEAGQEKPLVILGGGREATKPKFELYVADDSVVNPGVGEALRKFLPVVFPGKYEADQKPEMEWTGIMGYTKTGDPFVGPVIDPAHPDAHKGQYISAGYTGHGMPRAFSCAEAVAQMIVADIQGKEWEVPEWLPRHHLTQNRLNE